MIELAERLHQRAVEAIRTIGEVWEDYGIKICEPILVHDPNPIWVTYARYPEHEDFFYKIELLPGPDKRMLTVVAGIEVNGKQIHHIPSLIDDNMYVYSGNVKALEYRLGLIADIALRRAFEILPF